jgi:hypothetical protein
MSSGVPAFFKNSECVSIFWCAGIAHAIDANWKHSLRRSAGTAATSLLLKLKK